MSDEILANADEVRKTQEESQSINRKQEFDESEKNKKLIKKVQSLLNKAKKHRANYDKDWIENYRFFRGAQWPEERPSYKHSEVINLIFQTIQSQTAIQLDKRPRISYSPQEPSDLAFAQVLDQLISADWDKYNWLEVVTENVLDAHLYSAGIGSIVWNPELENGLGAIDFSSCDPVYFYPDPDAEACNKKCDYIIKIEPMELKKIKRRWSKGKHVKPDIDETKDNRNNLEPSFNRSVEKNVLSTYEYPDKQDYRKRALVIYCYIKDDETIEEEIEEDGKKKVVEKLKYPKGRTIIIANNVVLQDRASEYDDGLFPYSRLINYQLPREFWGISEVENLKKPQMMFNKLVSFAMDVLYLTGNPIWVVDNTSGVDGDYLTNEPGLIVEKNPGSEVRREQGTNLQPYVLQLIDNIRVWFDGLSGANDITRGVRPEGVSAAAAIKELQDAAQTRLRQKARHMDSYLQELGQLYQSRVLQYYTVPRVFKVTGEDGMDKFFKFFIEDMEDEYGEINKQATMIPISFNDKFEAISGEAQLFNIKGKFDVKVNTGSSLPFSKIERENRAYQLYDRQIIDAEEVLDLIDYPNKEKVLERLKAREAAAAQQAALQQQA